MLVQLEGVTDRTAAEALKGSLVGAARAKCCRRPAKDEYYWADLIGLDVVNGRDERLGAVKELIESAASDVLVVAADDGTERLLPFVSAVVLDVDVAAKRIRALNGKPTGDDAYRRRDHLPGNVRGAHRMRVTRRALEDGIWSIGFENPRDHVTNNYRTVDDRPYGGGPGMVMLPEPLETAINAAKAKQQEAVWRKAASSTSRRRANR